MTTDWPFAENYRAEFQGLPPTQIKEVQKRLAKKGVVDMAAPSEEALAVLNQVTEAYNRKKTRARAASSKSRAAKGAAEEPAIDDVAVEAIEPEAGICGVVAEVVAEAEAVPEPAAAAPPKTAPRAAKRVDNVAQEKNVAAAPRGEVAPAPKRPVASEAPTRRRGGLCAMVAEVSINASP